METSFWIGNIKELVLRSVYSILITLPFFLANDLTALADLSFIVIDMKYSQERGVKICEMQPGSFSRFSGANSPDEPNAIPNLYCKFLEKYKSPCYFTHPLYQKMKEAFVQHHWTSAHSVETLNKKLFGKKPQDPDNLFDYECFLFSLNIDHISEGAPNRFPHILFLDRAILPYSRNKYLMNSLLDRTEETQKLRPIWKIYPKGSSKKLIEAILQDIPGERIVIKPIQSTMGRGVIILEKCNLETTLNYIFLTPKEVLIEDLERSYSHYAVDKSDFFLVEEFIESDPLFFGEEPFPYDCTMRVMAILSYHLQVADMTLLKAYWYSPSKPMKSPYSLIESHKAKGTFFAEVDLEIQEKVKKELFPALLKVYQTMLNETP